MKDYSLYDNKAIVIEELKEPQVEENSKKIMIYVRYLDAKNFHLEEPKEIFVTKEKTTLHEVGQVASKALNIPVKSIEKVHWNNYE